MQIDPRRALHSAIFAYTAFHLVLAAFLPLFAHEAHYAVYARELALSYLDHPPLAAWLQALVLPFSGSDFALRLLPIALSVLAQYLLARLTTRVFPETSPWTPVVAVLLLQGTLVFHASLTLSPDAPLVPLALAVALVALRLLEQPHTLGWALLGLFLGLAGLAKYTAVTLPLSIVAVLLLREGWRGLLRPGLWLAGLVTLAIISPVLFWNAGEDWVTVRFHAENQFDEIDRWSASGFLGSLGIQLGYYSPLVVIGGVLLLGQRLRSFRDEGDDAEHPATRDEGPVGAPTNGTLLLICFALPVLGLYLYTALESRASPHWSVLGWLFLLPLVADWVLRGWHRPGRRWLAKVSAAYSATIVLALVVILIPLGKWPDFRHPQRLALGFEAATERGQLLLEALPDRGYESAGVLFARNWHHGGLYAWFAEEATVLSLFHDLNPLTFRAGYAGADAWGVLIYPWDSREPRLTNMTRDFDCEPIDALPVYFGESLLQVFHFYACYGKPQLADLKTQAES